MKDLIEQARSVVGHLEKVPAAGDAFGPEVRDLFAEIELLRAVIPPVKARFACDLCGEGMADGATLIRQNEKGVEGVWRCARCLGRPPEAPAAGEVARLAEIDLLIGNLVAATLAEEREEGNDREWTLIGQGETLRAAIDTARATGVGAKG